MSNIYNASFVRHSGDATVYSVHAGDKSVTLYVDASEGIDNITLDAVFGRIKADPGIASSHFSKSKPFGPINGHFFYFPTEGGGLFSSGRKQVKIL